MKRLALALIVLATPPLLAQEAKPAPEQLPPAPWTVAEAAKSSQWLGLTWSLSIHLRDPGYPVLSRDALVAQLADTVLRETPKNDLPTTAANLRWIKANVDLVAKALNAVPKLAGGSMIRLIGKGDEDAAMFARRGDATCLIVPSVATETIFNTVRVESKQRAERIATDVAIPVLKAIAMLEKLDSSGVTCVGVGVSSGAKSFIETPGSLGDMTEYEYLMLAGSVADVRSFTAGELADEELLGKLDVFWQDRSHDGIKKILLGVRP